MESGPRGVGTRVAKTPGMRNTHALALALPLAFATGCYVEVHDTDPPGYRTGDLTLRYDFEGRSCLSAGVHRISVRLDGLDHGEVLRDSFDCARYEAGVTFEGLREDTYEVRIEGRDVSGALVYSLEEPRLVDVVWASHREYDVAVPGTGGALTLYWTFEGWGGCGEVDELRVRLTDPDGYVYDDARYACDFGGVTYDVLAHGIWQVSLDGLDRFGRVLYRAGPRNVVVIGGASNEYTIDLATSM